MNWQTSLAKLNAINETFEEQAPPPAENIDEFLKFAAEIYGLHVPTEFTAFWQAQNGLEFDGNVFYHADSVLSNHIDPMDPATNNAIIASNIIWHENDEFSQYIFLGDGNINWFVYDAESKNYLILDKPSGDAVQVFETFEDFFSSYLAGLVDQT